MPNNDLISRDALVNDLSYCAPELFFDRDYLLHKIMTQPTIDAAPVAHGRWIEIETEDAYDFVGIKTWALKARCSECDFVMKFIEAHTGQYIYCPNCSARMDARMDGGD